MLSAQDSQFRLMEDGSIFYQSNATNPLPGEALAQVIKGQSILKPAILIPESALAKDQDKGRLHTHLEGWLARHIAGVLEPLANLMQEEDALSGPARGIAFQIHEAMGIVPRAQIEDLIAALDQEGRRALRAKKIRLGPVLVFIPALNKPAAVRLRALLWGLFNDRPLPMATPKDGIVSMEVDPQTTDRNFYRAVGYPVFGNRAIRIDMLDRVISAVYDSAKDGKFRAEHKMAEWLGCSIDGLYGVLSAMGHKKIEEPVAETANSESAPAEEGALPAPASAETPEGAAQTAEGSVCEAVEKTQDEPQDLATEQPQAVQMVAVKPVLALFRLAKGRVSDRPVSGRVERKPGKFEAKKSPRDNDADRKPKFKPKAPRDSAPKEKMVLHTGPAPKPEDSPFAILGQLKKKADE
ncbi:MAG: hypothetical protein IT559_02725 [Alphaproteobacteria bacterium]|nr:hypothetical protein [Alphaproteobacteria bacterium]